MSFLLWLPIAIAVWGMWDFTQVEKTYQGGKPLTDAQRVAKLYREIKSLKCNQQPLYPSLLDTLQLNCSTVIETIKTIAKYKYQGMLARYYTPQKLGELLVVPYYSGGSWYNALVKHTNKGSKILRITTVPHIHEGNRHEAVNIHHIVDVTEQVKSYAGPGEDFYGQDVTPRMLGYNHLGFHVIKGINKEVIIVKADETINQKLS